MTMQDLKLFDQRQIRTVWDEEQEKWYFCINDVIVALTDCKDPVDYFKKVRKRDPELDIFVRGTICPPHQFISTDGKRHSAKCMDIQSVLRLVQSIPSKKAEPFKRWLAQVGAERIHQMQDPELGIQQSLTLTKARRRGALASVATKGRFIAPRGVCRSHQHERHPHEADASHHSDKQIVSHSSYD